MHYAINQSQCIRTKKLDYYHITIYIYTKQGEEENVLQKGFSTLYLLLNNIQHIGQ